MSKLTRADYGITDNTLNYATVRSYLGSATAIKVDCRAVRGDGGHGTFYLNTADTTSIDNDGTILVDASGRRWVRDYTGDADVRWFGAVADGATDSSVAIKKAIDACTSVSIRKYGTLSYVLSSNIKSSVNGATIKGIGMPTLHIAGGSTADGAIELTGSNTKVSCLRFTAAVDITPVRLGNLLFGTDSSPKVSNVTVKNLQLVSTGHKGPNHGNVVLIGVDGFTVKNTRCIGTPTAGSSIEILGCDNGSVVESYAENGILGNIHVTSAAGSGFPSRNVNITRCTSIHNITGIDGDNGIKVSRDCYGVHINKCRVFSSAIGTFTGNDHAIFLQGVDGCTVTDNEITIIGTQVSASDRQFKSAIGLHGHDTPLRGCNNNRIDGNIIRFIDPGSFNRGVFIYSQNNQSFTGNKVSNNKLSSNSPIDAFVAILNNNPASGSYNDTTVCDNTANNANNTIKSESTTAPIGTIIEFGNTKDQGLPVFNIAAGTLRRLHTYNSPSASRVTLAASQTKLGLTDDNLIHQVIILNKNLTGATISIDGFVGNFTAVDGRLVTITSVFDVSSANSVVLVNGGTGKFRLAGATNFTLAGFSSVTLMAQGNEWVEISRRA